MRTVTTIIPAFNEEKTIGRVVQAATGSQYISEVVVINDGSCDATSLRAAEAGARVIDLELNRGKGGALQVGIESTDSDVVLFLDADLVGLTAQHVDAMVHPVYDGEVEMTVGLFGKGRAATDLAQKIAPFLSGQRAVSRTILKELPNMDHLGFGVEVALTRYVKDHAVPYKEIPLPEVSQIMKEEKFGLVEGFSRRLRMYWEIVRTMAE